MGVRRGAGREMHELVAVRIAHRCIGQFGRRDLYGGCDRGGETRASRSDHDTQPQPRPDRAEGMRRVPAASVLMRLLGFMVPCLLALAGVQPLIGAAAGAVGTGWAV